MKNKKIFILSSVTTIVTTIFTIYSIVVVPENDYVNYQKLMLALTYGGIFNLGVYNTYKMHFRQKAKEEISKHEILMIFVLNSLIPVIVLIMNGLTVNYDITLMLVGIIIVNIATLEGLLLQLFGEYYLFYYITILTTIFNLIFINNVNIIILFIVSKLFMILFITYFLFKNSKVSKGKITGYKKGFMILLANWLVIVLLNMDKNIVINNGFDFYSYSIVASVSLTFATIFNPFSTIIFNSNINYNVIKKMVKKIHLVMFVLFCVGLIFLLSVSYFGIKEMELNNDLSFVISFINFNNLIQILQVFLVLVLMNILIPQILVLNFKRFFMTNILIFTLVFFVVELAKFDSILEILIFKYIVLFSLIYIYMKILKKELNQVVQKNI